MTDEINKVVMVEQSEPLTEYQVKQKRDEQGVINAEIIVNKKWFKVYWLLFFILCFLLIESFFTGGVALGTVIWFALAETVAIFFAKYCTGKLNKTALWLAVPIGLINISHLLFYSVSVQIITWPAALILFAVQLTYLSKPDKVRLFDSANIADVLLTIFVNALSFITFPFKGLLKFNKDSDKRTLINVMVGVLVAIPIAGIFVLLFSSADEAFATFIRNLTKDTPENTGTLVRNLFFSAIMCIFVSAAFVGANARELAPPSGKKLLKEVNNVTLGTILVMVAVVIVLYVGIQFNHWFGNVPANYIQMDEYAHSARTGFNDLVVASGFLLALIVAVTMLSTKRDGQLVLLIKLPLILLCACNAVVLYSAIEKIAIYIMRSGITSSRILALWFVAVILACMAGAVVKILRFSFKALNLTLKAIVVLVCVLSFCNMDYWVAKNHIYLAEHHKIGNLEKGMLSQLSYAAAKPLAEYKARLLNGTSAHSSTRMQCQEEVLEMLDMYLRRYERIIEFSVKENPIMEFNFSRLAAQRVLNTFEPNK
jgi:hypothetical protein